MVEFNQIGTRNWCRAWGACYLACRQEGVFYNALQFGLCVEGSHPSPPQEKRDHTNAESHPWDFIEAFPFDRDWGGQNGAVKTGRTKTGWQMMPALKSSKFIRQIEAYTE